MGPIPVICIQVGLTISNVLIALKNFISPQAKMEYNDPLLQKFTEIIQKIIRFDDFVEDNLKTLRETRKEDVKRYFGYLLKLLRSKFDSLVHLLILPKNSLK